MADPRIADILEQYAAPLQPRGEVLALGNAGGLSGSAFWRYQSEVGELAFRAWPAGVQPARLGTIHRWSAEAARRSGLPLPVPFADRSGWTFRHGDGRLWELTPWLPGEPDLDRPPSVQHVRAAFEALGRFHASLEHLGQQGASPALASRLAELGHLERSGFEELASVLDASRPDSVAEAGLRWLRLARALVARILPSLRLSSALPVRLQPCLRDARPDHFLFQGDRLSGLIDLGGMDLECVSADVARLCGDWLGERPGLRAEALASHAAGRRRPLDEPESRLMPAFEASADVLIAGHWLRWHFLEGRRFDESVAVAQGVARGLQRAIGLAGRLGLSPLIEWARPLEQPPG
ncbi:homoserine kinase [Aquisphaera giovannonii]|uniref:Homoserine kinase n=1 Tax=Aquisphaera giovannonii TaxID=406548 RepID=A0A5B9W0H8_9BACT|nr:phosphotransferase [Aquisphaera giovannonii]QEH33714.1 homoserine kinase [Aquisphaera giovannonii]